MITEAIAMAIIEKESIEAKVDSANALNNTTKTEQVEKKPLTLVNAEYHVNEHEGNEIRVKGVHELDTLGTKVKFFSCLNGTPDQPRDISTAYMQARIYKELIELGLIKEDAISLMPITEFIPSGKDGIRVGLTYSANILGNSTELRVFPYSTNGKFRMDLHTIGKIDLSKIKLGEFNTETFTSYKINDEDEKSINVDLGADKNLTNHWRVGALVKNSYDTKSKQRKTKVFGSLIYRF
jgi:hypothetical protein